MSVREAAGPAAERPQEADQPATSSSTGATDKTSDNPLVWAAAPIALETHKLTKHYPVPRQKEKRIAVNSLDLNVSSGEIFGFLGPNGAGKTTTIKMLLGFTRPTSGGASLFEHPIEDDCARAVVGYVPEQPYFPKFLTVLEVVRAHGSLAGVPVCDMIDRADACLKMVRMHEHRFTPLSKLSKGMTQRVGLATALIGDPKLLILDEPSSGLDPVGRKELRDLLQELKSEGKTIFLSSHLLSEMESVCDRVGILADGKLVACDTPANIVQAKDFLEVEIEPADRDEVFCTQITQWGGQVEANADNRVFRLVVPTAQTYPLMNFLEEWRIRLSTVTPQRETLEDAFLRLVS